MVQLAWCYLLVQLAAAMCATRWCNSLQVFPEEPFAVLSGKIRLRQNQLNLLLASFAFWAHQPTDLQEAAGLRFFGWRCVCTWPCASVSAAGARVHDGPAQGARWGALAHAWSGARRVSNSCSLGLRFACRTVFLDDSSVLLSNFGSAARCFILLCWFWFHVVWLPRD